MFGFAVHEPKEEAIKPPVDQNQIKYMFTALSNHILEPQPLLKNTGRLSLQHRFHKNSKMTDEIEKNKLRCNQCDQKVWKCQ